MRTIIMWVFLTHDKFRSLFIHFELSYHYCYCNLLLHIDGTIEFVKWHAAYKCVYANYINEFYTYSYMFNTCDRPKKRMTSMIMSDFVLSQVLNTINSLIVVQWNENALFIIEAIY